MKSTILCRKLVCLATGIFALTTATPSATAATLTYAASFGTSGEMPGPLGMVEDSAGNVWAADLVNGVDRFDPGDFAGSFTTFGSFGSGTGQFSSPEAVAEDQSGFFYVADTGNNRIIRFDPNNFASTFTSFGSIAIFASPMGIAVDGSGNVWVLDQFDSRVWRFNPSDFAGTITSFGTAGSGTGQFKFPTRITIDGAGNIWVADTGNNRIVRFDGANFAGTFTTFGSSSQFHHPTGVAVDALGTVYVADFLNNRIESFNPADFAGTFAAGITTGGPGLLFATDIMVDQAGRVFIGESGSVAMQEFTGAAVVTPEPSTMALFALAMGAFLTVWCTRNWGQVLR